MWSCVFRCQTWHLPKKLQPGGTSRASACHPNGQAETGQPARAAPPTPDALGAWAADRFRWGVVVREVGPGSPSQWTARTPRPPAQAQTGSAGERQRQPHCTGSNARQCSTMPRCARWGRCPPRQTCHGQPLHGRGQPPSPCPCLCSTPATCWMCPSAQTMHAPTRRPDTAGRPQAHT